jgi:murein DD-endopeptidase MepM/ murein hydrolase activator NlpD
MEQNNKTHWSEKPLTRWIANLIAIAAVVALAFVAWQRVIANPRVGQTEISTLTSIVTDPPPTKESDSAIAENSEQVDLNQLESSSASENSLDLGIARTINFDTVIPSRPRVDVITYTVQQGDTLFGIADNFGLKPETLLWGNFETLKDNPHLLKPEMVLNILPTNGVYYQWHEGDSVDRIASEFKTETQAILDYPGNRIDLTEITEGRVNIPSGTWLIIPDGKRPLKDWGPPAISRANPAVARYYGEGACGSVYEGAIGTGTFVWPTAYHGISGYTYGAIHPAIDIGGTTGDAIVASDSGVVVFAGWSNFGYGYMIVIDHGNGFQTAYAHLSAVAVGCGQSVFQGGYIGAMGSTGNSTGPHLHYEISFNGAKPNPLDYLP